MRLHWFTTLPNQSPFHKAHTHGADDGQIGWKLHAVVADGSETFANIGKRRALCGLRPRHGWSMDLFIEDKCKRCLAKVAAMGADHEA